MGLFVEWIGRGDGENEMENEMSLISVAVGRNGNGRVVAEYRDAVGERVEVDVPIVRHYPCNDTFGVGGCNGDGLGRCDAVGNGIQQGEFHYGEQSARDESRRQRKIEKILSVRKRPVFTGGNEGGTWNVLG